MKCFNHPETDAVGICKNCSKGLCKACLTELENGIACTETCVEETRQINALINRNKKVYQTTSGAYSRNSLIYAGLGLVFIVFGLITEGLLYFMVIVGLIFFVGAIFSAFNASKIKKI